jgi:hypothetical protein
VDSKGEDSMIKFQVHDWRESKFIQVTDGPNHSFINLFFWKVVGFYMEDTPVTFVHSH